MLLHIKNKLTVNETNKIVNVSGVQHSYDKSFYAQKQLLLSAHLSHRSSVCLSICLSHGWISQKRCKLRSPNLHRRLPGRL